MCSRITARLFALVGMANLLIAGILFACSVQGMGFAAIPAQSCAISRNGFSTIPTKQFQSGSPCAM
jgi:hypothetical protein